MDSKSKLFAAIFGIVDVMLVVFLVMFFVINGKPEDNESVVTATTEEFVPNADSYGASSDEMKNMGMITANYNGAILTPTPLPTPVPTATPIVTETPAATETPLPTEEAAPAPVINDADFIFPYSDERNLTEADLSVLGSHEECQRAINEIYARHGYRFHEDKNPVDYAYFNSLAWYQALPKIDSQDEVRAQFNGAEQANVESIIQWDSARFTG